MRTRFLFACTLVAVTAAVGFSATAIAAPPTSTTITTPADGAEVALATNKFSFPVDGTSDGTSGAVVLFCLYVGPEGDRRDIQLSGDVPVAPNGTFSHIADVGSVS